MLNRDDSNTQPPENQTYHFRATFAVQHMPIEHKEWSSTVQAPTILHVHTAIMAKILAKYPTADQIELLETRIPNERFKAEQTAKAMSLDERRAAVTASNHLVCRRSNTARESAAHWAVCNKLVMRGVFSPEIDKGHTLTEFGIRVANIIESWSRS